MNINMFDSSLVFQGQNGRGYPVKQYMFSNKYGASVIFQRDDEFEVAVITLGEDNELIVVTDTHITSDVMRLETEEEVVEVILKIKELPKRILPESLQWT